MIPEAPAVVVIGGAAWMIARVWPGDPAPFEARRGGEIRGGLLRADGTAEMLAPGEDPALPALGALARRGTIVSHRPGRRAVVRLAEGKGYAKALRRGRGEAAADAHERGADAFSGGFAVPRLLARGADAIEIEAIPGRTLHELGGDRDLSEEQWRAAWRAWREAWVSSVADADASALPPHDAQDEARILSEWAERAAERARDDREADLLRTAAGRLAGRVVAGAGPARAAAHRDLHDKQLLWDPEHGIGVIDLDTCARADPALDLGNLLAHVEFAVVQGAWPRRRARLARGEIASAARALDVGPERLDAWRRAARFRIASVHLLRPPGRDAARRDLLRLCLEETGDA
ncbi:hypothetical protein [Microbacterium sp. gxy059]|uniref:hypothetical protein n=1 Tax=Microbacterium sp. gxy059 TaxID=2957199 RepID=UPI003D9904FA